MKRATPVGIGLLILLCWLYSVAPHWQQIQQLSGGDIKYGDPTDSQHIIDGALAHPHLLDTHDWWHGKWIAGNTNAYYRPVTSQLFWLEYKLFGAQGMTGFTVVHCLSHLAAMLLLYGFVCELAGRRLAVATTCLFGLGATAVLSLPDTAAAIAHWVCDEDIWMAGFYVLALWVWLRCLRTEKKKYLFWTLLFYYLTIGSKEMGYTFPVVAAILLWKEGKLWQWSKLIPLGALAILLLLLRWPFLGGLGTRDGSNGSWWIRGLTNEFGITARIIGGDLLPLSLALLGLALLCYFTTGNKKRCGLLAFLGFYCFFVTHILYSETLEDTFYRLFGSALPWVFGFYTGIYLLLVWRFLYKHDRLQIFAYGWAFCAYLPMLMAAVWTHGWYLPAMGWSLWLAYGVLALVEMGAPGVAKLCAGKKVQPTVVAS